MKYIAGFLFMICLGCNNPASTKEPDVATLLPTADGSQLFRLNCAQCHKPAEDFAAPKLAGVQQRWNNKDMLYRFIANPAEVISIDPYAKALHEKWNNAVMQPFPQLTHEEIDAILAYCNNPLP